MKSKFILLLFSAMFSLLIFSSCELTTERPRNESALEEQAHTELNQRTLIQNQPIPNVTWSMERDNLIKLKKLQNDRTVTFFMYIFIEGCGTPIGYYQVNKVSSVNSQLTNPSQIIYRNYDQDGVAIDSPSEDGSYGTNGDAVFGFTPEDICIETNMKFICATVPLTFNVPVHCLAVITGDQAQQLLNHTKTIMNK